MNTTDEELLDAIARQARVAYATQQLNEYCTAMQNWQHRAEQDTENHGCAQHQLEYYARQVERWQNYLATLA